MLTRTPRPPVPVVALVALPVLREVSHLHVLLWPAAAARLMGALRVVKPKDETYESFMKMMM